MIADLKFTPDDTPDEIELKHKIIKQYNARTAARRDKKEYVIQHTLYDYKVAAADESSRPEYERDLIARLKPLKRLREPEKHDAFVDLLLKKQRVQRYVCLYISCTCATVTGHVTKQYARLYVCYDHVQYKCVCSSSVLDMLALTCCISDLKRTARVYNSCL
jgi:hypothetical protein